MTKITDCLWIGNSKDATDANLPAEGINAMLNVAHDLQGKRGWTDNIVYAQCGLIDGPGNHIATYHAAILMLAALVADGKRVLVCCHNGGRSLAVVLCYLNLTGGRGWDGWLSLLRERNEFEDPHEVHRRAFDRINWRLLSSALEG